MLSKLPNLISLFRIIIIPFFIASYENDYLLLACIFASLAGLSDFLDGYVARRFKVSSDSGALLDPVADKLYVVSALGYFTYIGLLPLWFFIILLIRNVAQISVIPILGWWLKIPFKVRPKFIPKLASALSFVLAGVLILKTSITEVDYLIRYLLLPVGVLMEIQILVTFLPRYYQVAVGTHDTFE